MNVVNIKRMYCRKFETYSYCNLSKECIVENLKHIRIVINL